MSAITPYNIIPAAQTTAGALVTAGTTSTVRAGGSLLYLPTGSSPAMQASGLIGTAPATQYPQNVVQAATQYNILVMSWALTNNFPKWDGTIYPEEQCFIHFLIHDIVNNGTHVPVGLTTGTQGDVASVTSGCSLQLSACTPQITNATYRITMADLPLRTLQRPWHPFILRELITRTILKNA